MYFLRPLEHTTRAPITMVITHTFFIFQSLPISPFNNLYISVFSNSLYFYPHVTWNCQINYINFFFFFIDKYKIWYSKLSHLQSIFKLYNYYIILVSQLLHLICTHIISLPYPDQLPHTTPSVNTQPHYHVFSYMFSELISD